MTETKDIEFTNNCNCNVDYTLLNKAMKWYGGDKTQHSKKCIFLNQTYPTVTIGNEKVRVHRLLMMYQVKKRLESNICVHHKDENRLNAQVDNLQKLTKGKHQALHLTGKPRSEEVKKKISETMRKRKNEQN